MPSLPIVVSVMVAVVMTLPGGPAGGGEPASHPRHSRTDVDRRSTECALGGVTRGRHRGPPRCVQGNAMRIAILGAGNTGTCTALELASHGLDVDLFDENDTPVSRASFHNEGKVHLGILYAKDSTLRTAKLMIDGALSFAPLLDRWIDFTGARDRIVVSTPFFYGVHVGTMVDVDRLRRHYAACRQLFVEAQAHTGSAYLGVDRSVQFDELTPAQMAALVSPEYFLTMFRTSERAVDPRTVAMLLRAAALAHPRIHFVGKASRDGGGAAESRRARRDVSQGRGRLHRDLRPGGQHALARPPADRRHHGAARPSTRGCTGTSSPTESSCR